MKVKVWSWRDSIRQSNIHSTTKLVLYNLSIYMNEAGDGCFPSTKTQSNDTGLSERTICTHLQKACDSGFITKSVHGYSGQGWARNEYIASYPKGTEPNTKALNLMTKGTEPNDKKALKEVQSNSPSLNTPKNTPISIPSFIDNNIWNDWVEYRNEIKKPLKPSIVKAQVKKFVQWHDEGYDVNEIINTTISNGWTGLFEPKGKVNKNGKSSIGQQGNELLERIRAGEFGQNSNRDS